MATSNIYVGPQDGWTEVLADGGNNVRISIIPETHPFFVYGGDDVPVLNGGFGTGTVVFAVGVPVAAQTVVIGTETYTFRAARALPFEVTIGGTNLITAANFRAAVAADSALVTPSIATNTVTVRAKVQGTAGNYAMSTAATNVTVGGAAMTGGTNSDTGVQINCGCFQIDNSTTDSFYVRLSSNVPNSTNYDGRARIDVYAAPPVAP